MRNLCWPSIVSVLLALAAQKVSAIVGTGRDVVLTPKQALQVNGKRLFYEEQQQQPAADRSWEHTLKHVTYVTLFTDAALGAASGNLSQLHDYHDFLQTPYVPATAAGQAQAPSSRFGDIVTLASGRLEQLSSNGSYRFVEGATDARDAVQRADPSVVQTRAVWRVQRIRHRDGEQSPNPRYHYEMKYSVSPVAASLGWPPQSYIQKESDYPQSFGRIAYEEKRDQTFAQRRQDRQPQATFVRGIFQPPPPPPPASALNIGEYLKAGPEPPKSSPKIELFPGLFNLGLRPNYIPATTFRPSYPIKFAAHPELTTPLERFPLPNELSGTAGDAGGVPAAAPPVTHHFHHHFYMATGHGNAQPELGYRPSLSTPTPPTSALPLPHSHSHSHSHYHQHEHSDEGHREVQFPTNHASGSTESLETDEDLHHSQDQHALRSPHVYSVYDPASRYQSSKLATPLLIYAGAGGEADSGEDHKSFVHSEPLEETIYRYSEPDPLYVHQNPVDVLQLETPQQQQQPHHAQATTGDEEEPEDQLSEHVEGGEQRPAGSQKQAKLATTPATTTTTTTTSSTEAMMSSTTTAKPTVAATPSKASFVSTSTSFTPLRALSRYRTTPRITAGRSTTSTTTTTETPSFAKWKQRRKENATHGPDSKPKSSLRHESKVVFIPTTTATITMTTKSPAITTEPPATTSTTTVAVLDAVKPAPGREVIEVLTQKSVSKSVSIKVGENGEEIPIIVDDDENEVKPS
ncbi:uncharacterized protein LOC133849211 [Drosophila sulfurigaster albostrigata]|uniref:uncharacterized protein LOC133849211 n=1 Tax=Drosophila sulfurigaster albostrigata TaxID=89887 RepID=UPI002D21CA16|nr:uncharacterized protein LOC133849211 [Drosophila sulfurigaster albostrigata]